MRLDVRLTFQAVPDTVQHDAGRHHGTHLVEDITTGDFAKVVTHSNSKLQYVATKVIGRIDLGRHVNEGKWDV